MTIEDNTLAIFEPFLLGYCNCGCGKILNKLTNKFISGHNLKIFTCKGLNNPNWKCGRRKHDKYWLLSIPDYWRSNKQGYVLEHIYFFEQYHKCCLLSWGNIHHIEPVTDEYCNNMIWNLQGIIKKQHTSFHRLGKHKDRSDRKCFSCGSDKTYIRQPTSKTSYKIPRPSWQHLPWDKVNWYCHTCHHRLSRHNKLKSRVT